MKTTLKLLRCALLVTLLAGCGTTVPGVKLTSPAGLAARATTATAITLDRKILDNHMLECVVKPNALAMNIQYEPILKLRSQLDALTKLKLGFLQSWHNEGEAHVTVITPPECKVLIPVLSSERLGQIAREEGIQSSDLAIEGLGSGHSMLGGKTEETYFVIVKSEHLLRIRERILQEYLAKGGKPKAFFPDYYFPHITIGFTKRDLFETDGVIKDVEHSLDKRFNLVLSPS